MNQLGYFSLLGGVLLLTSLAVWLRQAARTGTLKLNSVHGIRTPATLSSQSAWERGHKAAGPYLLGTAIVGGVATVTAIGVGIGFVATGDDGYTDLITVPSVGFFLQTVVYAVGLVKANQAAKVLSV